MIKERPVDLELAGKLESEGLSPLFARILAARGVKSREEINFSLGALPHFASLKNIKPMAEAISNAIMNRQKIVIAADYDADGATACAVALRFFRAVGAPADFVVPRREKEGYGLSPALVDAADSMGAKIILTVDNGIAAIEAVAYAKSRNIEVLVTDHHLPGAELPSCLIVNPNQPGCEFPCKNLAGVGVIFYVLLAVRQELTRRGFFSGEKAAPNMADLLDLVALGTVADVVPLDRTNRILVAEGLKRIRHGRAHAGIKGLFAVAGRETKRAGAMDFGFALGPRLNAAGRLTDMSVGIRCLISDDEEEAEMLAASLESLNRERKETENKMLDVTHAALEVRFSEEQRVISVFSETFHPGVVGIVAGKLKEKYYRPTIVFAAGEEGLITGSARSIPGFHIRDALDRLNKAYPDLILKFGGHAMAAGLTLAAADFSRFEAAFEALARESLTPDLLRQNYVTDGSLSVAEMTLETAAELEGMIWGQGFEFPVFADDFRVVEQKRVGKKKNHLKLLVEKDGQFFPAVIFSCMDTLPSSVTLIYRLVADSWKNVRRLQLYVDHWQEKSS